MSQKPKAINFFFEHLSFLIEICLHTLQYVFPCLFWSFIYLVVLVEAKIHKHRGFVYEFTSMVVKFHALATSTQPVCNSGLKYSTVKPVTISEELSWRHFTVRLVCAVFTTTGLSGAPGTTGRSSVMLCGSQCGSTTTAAVHDVSPLSVLAVQVYSPESLCSTSVNSSLSCQLH